MEELLYVSEINHRDEVNIPEFHRNSRIPYYLFQMMRYIKIIYFSERSSMIYVATVRVVLFAVK